MAKNMQEQKGKERIVAKSKPTLNLASLVSTNSSTVQSPNASKNLGILKAPCQNDWTSTGRLGAREFNQDAASSSQAWQKDTVLDVSTRRLVATEEDQEHLNFPEDSKSTMRLVASGNSDTKGKDKIGPHHFQKSTDCVPHMEKVFSIVRHRYGLSPRDKMENLEVNAVSCGIFMSVTLQVAVHVGTNYTDNLRSTRNQPKKSLRQLFQVTRKLISDQTEITGITTIDWQQLMWRETTLLTDKAVQFATEKNRVFSDSVLCLGGISQEPVEAWESKIKWFIESRHFRELDRIDGEPMEFEWKNFPGFTTLGILDEIQKMMTELKCDPEHFQGRIIFMPVYNDINWGKRGNKDTCVANSFDVADYARKFMRGHWSILGPGSEKKWYGTHVCKPDGQWDEVAENMMINFAERGHPIFRASNAVERGELKSKGKGMKTIHFNGRDETTELILRTVISVNQLRNFGAVARTCVET